MGLNSLLTNHVKRQWSLIAITVVLSIVMFGRVVRIQLGPVDDHEIIRFIGADGQMYPWEIPSILVYQTEVGAIGDTFRFRPVYYLLRLLETQIFGANSFLWYANRVILVAISAYIVGLIAQQLCRFTTKTSKFLFGFGGILMTLQMSSLSDIVTRLGPSEIYLLVFVVWFFYLIIRVVSEPESCCTTSLLCLAAAGALGTKENGLVLLVPMAVVVVWQIQRTKLRPPLIIVPALASMCLGILVAVAVSLGYSQSSKDVYGVSRSFTASLRAALKVDTNMRVLILAVCIASLSVLLYLLRDRHWNTNGFHVAATLATALSISERVFYLNGFAEPRYLVISEIASVILFITLGAQMLALITRIFSQSGRLANWIVASLTTIAVGVASNSFWNSSIAMKTVIHSKIDSTQLFQRGIAEVDLKLRQNNLNSVVIQINSVWDYEPTFSVAHYVAVSHKNAAIFLNLQVKSTSGGLEDDLFHQLAQIQINGHPSWPVQEWRNLRGSPAICVTFRSSMPTLDTCVDTIYM